jgi:N-acetylglucosaminyldiphosphoundecaprenol N-acetyl-beta-D-mannosaminyltransferase
MKRVVLLGVPIDPLTRAEALARIQAMLQSHAQYHVMTPNSEMLVEAHGNKSFRELLNQTELNIPDSAGLLWAARVTKQHLPERVTGVDTVEALCRELTSDEPVFFLGAGDGVAEKAAQNLRLKNKGLQIAGTYAGSPRDEDAADIIGRINASGAKLLLVAYGAPKQDMWIDKHLHTMPSVRVAIGVGGTFDFIAGVRKRAPSVFRSLHLEWLWRVIREPRRIGRILNATVVFPLLILTRSQTSDLRYETNTDV